MYELVQSEFTNANLLRLLHSSHYPWYEIFYSLLNLTAEILNRSDNDNVELILEQIYNLEVPDQYGAPIEVVTPNLKDVRSLFCWSFLHNVHKIYSFVFVIMLVF